MITAVPISALMTLDAPGLPSPLQIRPKIALLEVLLAEYQVNGNILACRLRVSSVWKSKDHKIVRSRPELIRSGRFGLHD
jgi:hypothetical protein